MAIETISTSFFAKGTQIQTRNRNGTDVGKPLNIWYPVWLDLSSLPKMIRRFVTFMSL